MRAETYTVEAGMLVRSVMPKSGRAYKHACPLDTLEAVAHAIDAAGQDGIGLEALHKAIDRPWTQIAVALAFLHHRGCIEHGFHRRYKAMSGDVYLDALIEYHALREGEEQAAG